MIYEDIVQTLENLRKSAGSNYGLARTRALLDALGSPDCRLEIIHVAGTNGKGSVCEYLSRILRCSGVKAGCFRTPAVYSYEEQFCVNCRPLSRRRLGAYLQIAYEKGMSLGATAFEIETCAALYAFAEEGCRWAVIECGLGGLSDATNAIKSKRAAVITGIGLEHTAILGNTLLEISRQKAGIIKDCPSIVTSLADGEVREYFAGLGAVFADGVEDARIDCDGCKFTFGGRKYSLKMRGCVQPYNAALAIKTAAMLGFGYGAIRRGIASARLCGRIEKIKKRGRTFILDGSHNPQSFSALADYIEKYLSRGARIIYGCLSDKDEAGCLEKLRFTENFTAVPCDSYRATPQDAQYEICRRYFPKAEKCASVSEALDKSTEREVVICGSFTLLKEAKKWIEKR